MPKITIVIPCYNEETRLPVREYRRFLFNAALDIYFVNDGSTDRTIRLLEDLKDQFPLQVKILSLEKNVGKAEAVRRGILAANTLDKNDIIGFMDADLSTPFDEVDYFIREFGNPRIHFVFGSRFSRIGAQIRRFNHRHYFGRIVATLVSVYLQIPIYDSQCGAKFFHVGFARKLFMEPFVSRWLFDVEIFRRIALSNMKVQDCALELPLHTWIEKGGSKISFSDYLKLPLEFYRVFRHYIRKRNAYAIYRLRWTNLSTLTTIYK
ncbi:MAG TPA: glycosyltransferase [Puia sp.]|uniref:glycosyltransferase n=1 Tax=Puia sp. TaxID=2045100 RepID=UPI002BC7A3D7|nr:glycosyltransferase [Puia sp.]HVU95478.1 glycosyltransferase [Puia sp.]